LEGEIGKNREGSEFHDSESRIEEVFRDFYMKEFERSGLGQPGETAIKKYYP
jgi:hypothetical protein